MTEKPSIFEAARSNVSRPASISEASIVGFLTRQPEFSGVAPEVALEDTNLTAGISAGHIFFSVRTDRSDLAGRYVLRFDVLEKRLFQQVSLKSQYDVMRGLSARAIPTPEACWFDTEGVIIPGSQAIIMRAVDGRAPHMLYMEKGPYIEASPEGRRTQLRSLMEFARRLHDVPIDELDIPDVATRGGEGHFIDREINWMLTELYAHFPEEEEEGDRGFLLGRMRTACDEAANWLREHAPRDACPALLHGDITLGNVMFGDDDKIVAVLDWELCREGLPAEDIMWTAISARTSAVFYGTSCDEMPSAQELCDIYRDVGGHLEHLEFAAAMAAFQIGAIAAMAMRGMPKNFWAGQKLQWDAFEQTMQQAIAAAATAV